MNKKPLNISEEAAVQMPMKTVASLIIIVALGTMGYFQIVERLNVADTRIQLMEKELIENTEFRIKWPRGQLGSLPADSDYHNHNSRGRSSREWPTRRLIHRLRDRCWPGQGRSGHLRCFLSCGNLLKRSFCIRG